MKRILLITLFFLLLAPLQSAFAAEKVFYSDGSWAVHTFNSETRNIQFVGMAEVVNNYYNVPPSFSDVNPSAGWIYAPNIAASSEIVDLRTYYFSKLIFLSPSNSRVATITLADDDLAEVLVNGSSAGSWGSITDPTTGPAINTKTIDIAPYLRDGWNLITIRLQNGPASFTSGLCNSCTWSSNPSALLFSGTISSN